MAVGADDTVYATDYTANKVYRVFEGGKTLLAGDGSLAEVDGTGGAASFKRPRGIAVDTAGNVFVADEGGPTIRRITPAGVVKTLSPGITLTKPRGLAFAPDGYLAVVDNGADTIWKVPPWMTMAP